MDHTEPSQPRLSDTPICFRSSDFLRNNKHPSRYPLLVAPLIDTVHIHRVLVHGGSSFSIITTNTLDKMQVSPDRIKPVSRPFYGILPRATYGLVGQIIFPITLGKG